MKRFKHIKGTIAAVAVSGGVAAVLLGGTAVSTAFSSDSAQTATVGADTVAGTVSNGNLNVGGLLPGGSVTSPTITFHNTGDTTELVVLELGSLTSTPGADGNSPDLADLSAVATVIDGGVTTVEPSFTLADYQSGQHQSLGTLAANASATVSVVFTLAQETGNSWNGASVSIPYTVHFQDVSGSDSGYVPTDND